MRSVEILGVRLDDVTLQETIDTLDGFIQSGQPHLIATTNTEFVMAAQRDLEYRRLLNSADLSIPDGVGLIWGLRVLGKPIRKHVRGTDTVERLMALAAQKGYSVFLLGAAEGVAAMAAERLKARHPGLKIAGTYAGSPDPRFDDAIVEMIRKAGPVDILLVAYGAPAQEKWIARNMSRMNVPVAIGVGGVFDFFSGRVKRAPTLIRNLELEWLYRLWQQPWRWRRQLALPRFALCVLRLKVGSIVAGKKVFTE
ncbi:MAG: WecB/TagA/CpsF family glycosyltransferase [Dehalococcoidales bacterium]|nr:WecB/TagA/CpsF family glycosyltransferase [Dehalococcoidales bacterium]